MVSKNSSTQNVVIDVNAFVDALVVFATPSNESPIDFWDPSLISMESFLAVSKDVKPHAVQDVMNAKQVLTLVTGINLFNLPRQQFAFVSKTNAKMISCEHIFAAAVEALCKSTDHAGSPLRTYTREAALDAIDWLFRQVEEAMIFTDLKMGDDKTNAELVESYPARLWTSVGADKADHEDRYILRLTEQFKASLFTNDTDLIKVVRANFANIPLVGPADLVS